MIKHKHQSTHFTYKNYYQLITSYNSNITYSRLNSRIYIELDTQSPAPTMRS